MRRICFLILLGRPLLGWADPAEAIGKLDRLFAEREDPALAREVDDTVADAVKNYGNDYGVLWRSARHKQWLADGAQDDRLKKQLGKEAWTLGDRAIHRDPNRVEGYYYAAAGMGNYSQAIGILKALGEGLEGQFNALLDRAIKLDASFLHGAPLIAKGRYYYELPWPKRDLKKSAEMYIQVVQKYPENLRAYVYLAETQLKDGNAKAAKQTVAQALNGSVDYDPPEGRRSQQLGKKVLAAIEEELK